VAARALDLGHAQPHDPTRLAACVTALATLRVKNAATKIENNSKIFDALSDVKEIDLKID
jgi:hypothetical protein